MAYGAYSLTAFGVSGLAHAFPLEPMKILDDVNEFVNQSLVEQSGLFEDLAVYLYRIPLLSIPCEPVVLGINERLPYFDAVWSVAGIGPQYLSFQLDDLI